MIIDTTEQTAVVVIRAGRLRGAVVDGIHVFKGIPYAAPPFAANHRSPHSAWCRGPGRDATEWGAEPPQPRTPLGDPAAQDLVFDPAEPGEDCLVLKHLDAETGRRRPAGPGWTPGGMFEVGSGASYDGSRFARDGVVCVTINYRVGPVGIPGVGGWRREPWPARPGGRSRVGPRRDRRLRRRPRQRHDRRRIGRSHECRDAAVHAPRRRAVPARDPAERRGPPRHRPGHGSARGPSAGISRRGSDHDGIDGGHRVAGAAAWIDGDEGRADGASRPDRWGLRRRRQLPAVAAGRGWRHRPRPADRPDRRRSAHDVDVLVGCNADDWEDVPRPERRSRHRHRCRPARAGGRPRLPRPGC